LTRLNDGQWWRRSRVHAVDQLSPLISQAAEVMVPLTRRKRQSASIAKLGTSSLRTAGTRDGDWQSETLYSAPDAEHFRAASSIGELGSMNTMTSSALRSRLGDAKIVQQSVASAIATPTVSVTTSADMQPLTQPHRGSHLYFMPSRCNTSGVAGADVAVRLNGVLI
jgi:hypothetical protein